jgi:GntR family transcriptional regulator, histidine utilization repressor
MPLMTQQSSPENVTKSLGQRILSDIERRILSGEWPPGHRIPFEYELTAAYGCSRMTVNKALTQLAKTGLIERRRKVGSVVTRPLTQSAVLQIRDICAEVLELGLPYRFDLTHRRMRKSNAVDRANLGLREPGSVLALTCRHFAGNRPFCLEERIINLMAVAEAADEAFSEDAPGAWLVKRVPWSRAEHTIRAIAADDDVAAALSVAAGTACLVIERRTWSGDEPITHARLIYEGSTYALVARFTPGQS